MVSDLIYLGVPYSGAKNKSIIPCTREDEALAVAAGIYLCGVENIEVFMQNSGLGHSIDIITSLLIPYDIRINIETASGSDCPQHQFMNRIDKELLKIICSPDYRQ